MLSKLPALIAVTALTLVGDVVFDPTLVNPGRHLDSLDTATVTGCVLSWEGLGSADPLLGPAILARVGLVLDGPTGNIPVALDGRGHFGLSGLTPGGYGVRVFWDGNVVHEHTLRVDPLDGVVLAVHVDERPTGARVAVRAIGCRTEHPSELWSDSADRERGDGFGRYDELDVGPAVHLGPITPEPPAALGVRPPAETTLFDLEDGSWADNAFPSSFPDLLDSGMMIDPDVNVSRLHESDPMGFGGDEIGII